MNKRKFLSLKYDFMFKECIGKPGKEKRLQSLLQAITQTEASDLKIKGSVELKKYYKADKGGIIDDVIEEVRTLNQSEEMRTIEMYQELARMDRLQMLEDCREEALIEGKEKGIKEGIKEGKDLGKREGKKENTITTIVSMFKCNIDVSLIAKVFNMKKIDVIQILKNQKCI